MIYPAGMVSASKEKEASAEFLEYLKTEEVSEILEAYGFTHLINHNLEGVIGVWISHRCSCRLGRRESQRFW